MKGTVIVCLREVVLAAASERVWHVILTDAGFAPFTIFTTGEDVPDAGAAALLQTTCLRLGLTIEQAADAFGRHWIGTYSPRMYKPLYGKNRNAREFFNDINALHRRVVKKMANARPPRFELTWETPLTLRMHYVSHRGLIDVAVGMARAVGASFGEELVVTRVSDTEILIEFPAESVPVGPVAPTEPP